METWVISSSLTLAFSSLFGQGGNPVSRWAGFQLHCEHSTTVIQWLEEFKGWGEKVEPSAMSQVKLFKSILFTLSDSQSNTFLIRKANGQKEVASPSHQRGIVGFGCCSAAGGPEACV